MSMARQFVAGALFRKVGKTGACYKKLKQESLLPSTDIYNEKLTALLQYGFSKVPYYQKVMRECGIDGIDQINAESIKKLPLLTKDIIRANHATLSSSELETIKHNSNTSGGSTGHPVTFLQDDDFNVSTRAVKIIMDDSVGYSVGEKKLLLWGSERDLFHGKEPWNVRLMKSIKNEYWFNSFMMDHKKYIECIDWIRSNSPRMILAYVESIYELSRVVNKAKQKLDNVSVIMTTAGTLTDGVLKEIMDAFPNATIVNRYGSREVGDIACFEPSIGKMVVSHMTQFVEVLDEHGNHVEVGETGEVVVTNLVNRVMPLIRYRIGDMAKYGGVIDGKVVLDAVVGRTSDIFVNEKKQKIHGEYFTHLFYDLQWVSKFQVVQESVNHINIKIVSESESPIESDIDSIKEKIRLVMGKQTDISFDFVEEISPTASGKYRYTISKVT